MRFEILVELNGTKYQLDTYNEEPISLTYNVADINDISSRNSSFSKTIRLPETRNNREIFGDIADLGVNSSFNPNKKTKAWILVDTAVVFEGYLQLRKVFINRSTEQADYEVVIYADNDNFYKQLGDSFISDMDFSELDHIWSKDNIIQSFTASWNNGYYYPLIDYGQDWDLGEINGWTSSYITEVKVKDMFPATNVKYIFDKIFSLAGYNYISNFLTGDIFKNLYVPFNKTGLVRDINTSTGRFTVGMTQSKGYTFSTTQTGIPAYINTGNPGGQGGGGGGTINSSPFVFGEFNVPFNSEQSPFGDPDNLYDNTQYYYTAPQAGIISQKFVCNFDITFNWYISYTVNQSINPTPTPYASICFKRSRNPLTGATVSTGSIIPIGGSTTVKRFTTTDIPGITYNLSNNKQVRGQITCDELKDDSGIYRKLYPGERVWVEVYYSVAKSSLYSQGGLVNDTTGFWKIMAGTPILTFNQPNIFWNILDEKVSPNELIPYNSVIPKNVKKKDFINSIIKMFNLYVEPSKDYPKTLIIEPRDNYYQGGAFKDWTRKLNINTPIEEQILGETQNKKTIFKYKDDKDFYNVDYTTTTGGITYGEYNYYIDNDFTTGEKKVELIFSPTPVVGVRIPNSTAYSQITIPKIVKVQQDQSQPFTDSNIRILTRKFSSTKSSWIYGDYQFNSTPGPYGAYVMLTSLGFGNANHSFTVGDYIKVNQNDGGVLKPALQGSFKVVEIINTKTIVIDLPWSYVNSGAAVGGTCYPLDGLLGVNEASTWSFEGTRFRAYPYLGHYDNPLDPSYDINFGQTLGLYYPQNKTTNNNLFNIYWENFINELSDRDSRIITAEFYLTPYDIADFKFSDNIYIRDQYYKVNKIVNYDPTREALVKVELIKSQYISVPRAIRPGISSSGPANIGLSSNVNLRGYMTNGGVLTTTNNTPTGTGTIISGKNNIGQGIIVGRGNVISGAGSIAVGNNNNVNLGADGSVLVGNNNEIKPSIDLTPKFVFGSDNYHAGDGIVVGSNNRIESNTKNTNLFGNNNIIRTPLEISGTASYSTETSQILILGNHNVIESATISSITNVFISGTGSTVSSPNVSVFGNGVDIGTNSYGSYVIGDNFSLNTPDTFYVAKPTAIITSNTLDVGSKTTFTDSVRIIDSVNGTTPVQGSGFTSFIKLADLPFEIDAFTGETMEGIASNTVRSGQICYLDGYGRWLYCSSDDMYAAGEGGSQLGVVIHSASASDTTTALLRGFYSPGDYLRAEIALNIGQPFYIAPKGGGQGFITNQPPNISGNIVRVVGYLHNDNPPYTIRFSPDNTWIEID